MHESQAKGYYLEEIVRSLMLKSNFINIQTGDIIGRGADHQIDSYGTFMFSIPFIYPIRLISEVKWFKKTYKVNLNRIRDFVGVMIDISQNYFVPREIRSKRTRTSLRKERYTDCGAYFSATGFSTIAQDYAWAHGIYLISFTQDPILIPILNRAKDLIKRDRSIWDHQYAKKEDVVKMAQVHFQNDIQLRDLMHQKNAYFGILDELYPVMIITDGEFMFDPTAPDDISEDNMPLESDVIRERRSESDAIKERRLESDVDVNFQFRFQNTQFSFSLPWITSKKIIKAIKSTYGGETFAFLDIPLALEVNQRRYRRIFRIRLTLPNNIKTILS